MNVLSGIVRCAGCGFAMKPQGAGATSTAVYRCVKHSTHGVCDQPATIAKTRIEQYVIERFLAEYPLHLSGSPDDGAAAKLDTEATDAELAYRQQLDNLELRAMIGNADHDRLIGTLYQDWQQKLAAAADHRPTGTAPILPDGLDLAHLVQTLQDNGQTEELRQLLGSGIQAVFVRTAASRARNLPVADRVLIVWADDPSLDLPRQGRRYQPRRIEW